MTTNRKINFNEPYIIGNELENIKTAIIANNNNISFIHNCQQLMQTKYGFKKCLLTTSCTDALEMAAILLDIKQGDEVIVPSYTFVSTALAFVRQGAKIVFADSCPTHPNIDTNELEKLITPKTKAIVCVHYAGMACNMTQLVEICKQHNIKLIEDAAQAIDSHFNKKPLGSFGALATFSFHKTKNITCQEGGMLVVNDEKLFKRADIIWEKGTNRTDFAKGITQKYEWLDIGSSFLPSEITAAFLFAQMQNIDKIQTRRKFLWNYYYNKLKNSNFTLPNLPKCAEQNGHIFYLLCTNQTNRKQIAEKLKENGISTASHYLCLHKSPFYKNKYDGRILKNAEMFEQCLLRLPLYYQLKESDIDYIADILTN